MKFLVRLAIRLYPPAWRARYGAELEALVEDSGVRGTDIWNLVREAIFMQITSASFLKIVAGFGLAGVLAAGIWSASWPDQYISTAVLKLSDASKAPPAQSDTDRRMAQMRRLQQLQQGALSRKSLMAIIQQQNLFPEKRTRLPLEEVIRDIRNSNIRIHVMDSDYATVAVDFVGEDPTSAQAAARALVAALVEQNVAQSPAAGEAPSNLEVIGPASLPSEPVKGNRTAIIWKGGMAGLLLGLVCGGVLWLKQRRGWWGSRRVGMFAIAGMLLGLTVAFLLPNQFVSTAVLRAADEAKLQATITQILSDESLAAVIRRDGLFPEEVKHDGIEKVTRKMRNQHIRVQSVSTGGAMTAVVVSFRYDDRFMAQRVTRELVEQVTGRTNAQILDPASDPIAPSSPNRSQIALLGILLRLIVGFGASFRRGSSLAAA